MVNCAAGQMSKATKTLSDRQDTQDFNELWPQDCRNLSTMIFINLICVANPWNNWTTAEPSSMAIQQFAF